MPVRGTLDFGALVADGVCDFARAITSMGAMREAIFSWLHALLLLTTLAGCASLRTATTDIDSLPLEIDGLVLGGGVSDTGREAIAMLGIDHTCRGTREACAEAVRANRAQGGEAIWGLSVNVSQATCGRTDPRAVLAAGLRAAEETGLPLLFGPRRAADWALADQLPRLRSGDVVTYCFTDCPEGLLDGDRVRDAVWAARERGIRFDVGHGMGSFAFRVAELMRAA